MHAGGLPPRAARRALRTPAVRVSAHVAGLHGGEKGGWLDVVGDDGKGCRASTQRHIHTTTRTIHHTQGGPGTVDATIALALQNVFFSRQGLVLERCLPLTTPFECKLQLLTDILKKAEGGRAADRHRCVGLGLGGGMPPPPKFSNRTCTHTCPPPHPPNPTKHTNTQVPYPQPPRPGRRLPHRRRAQVPRHVARRRPFLLPLHLPALGVLLVLLRGRRRGRQQGARDPRLLVGAGRAALP